MTPTEPIGQAVIERKQHDTGEQAGTAIKNVLFATDFSAISEAALPYAAAICRRFGSTLHIAHVMSDTSLLMATGGVDYVSLGTMYDAAQAEAKEKIEQIVERLGGIPHRDYVRHGQIWGALAEIIAGAGIDLIVVGTHGRTGLGKLLLGSVAEDILRHAPCPVLTIGPKISGRDKLPTFPNHRRDLDPAELEVRHILLATDFAPNAGTHAERAVALAHSFGAQLTLLHVMEEYAELGSRSAPVEESLSRLRGLIPPSAVMAYSIETVLEFGPAFERILKVAQDREVDLIVLGARSAELAGTSRLPWSTAHEVIAKAHCPVLTLRD